MRAITGPERTKQAASSLNYHIRVEIANGSGTMIDLSNLAGRDWIEEVSIQEAVDPSVMGLTMTLWGGEGALSLHPLNASSTLNVDDSAAYSPLLHVGRFIVVYEAVTASGVAPVSGDWKAVFKGYADDPDSVEDGKRIQLTARDLSAPLVDTIIEQERIFGSKTGIAVETVIQQLADTYYLQGAVLVTMSGGSPGWMIREYIQERVPLWDAMRALAQQIGWDLRYRWSTGDNLVLDFYDPDRAKTVADDTLGPTEYINVNSVKLGSAYIRNVVKVTYVDRVTKAVGEYVATDVASIGVFGRRYLEIREASTSNIDTAVEAIAMANAILSDLSTPLADHAISAFHLWHLQIGDLIAFPPNSVHYDVTQKFAIVSITRTWHDGTGRIDLMTRGKPAGAYISWIRKHGEGLGDENDIPGAQFGTPIGEDTEGGGWSGDGMVWLDINFEPKTKFVKIFAEEGDDAGVAVPDITEITTAWTLYRQEGDVGSDPFWHTMVGMATRPNRWKRLKCIAYNKDGIAGPEFVLDPVEAKDTVVAIDGEITSLTVAPGLPNENVVTVGVGLIDPYEESWLFIMRNGIILARMYLGTAGSQVRVFTDTGINVQTAYVYEVFVWTKGLSGIHWLETGPVLGPPTPPTPPAPSIHPRFTNGTPYLSGGVVQISWTSQLPWFQYMTIETSPDGVVWTDWLTFTNPTLSTTNSDLTHQWYRLRAEDVAFTQVSYSQPAWYGGQGPPNTPTTPPIFINGTPNLYMQTLPLVAMVRCTYDFAAPWFSLMTLEGSSDGVAWGLVATNPSPTDTMYDQNIKPKWYRLKATGSGFTIYSAPAYWSGATLPGGGADTTPPTFSMRDLMNGVGSPYIEFSWVCANSQAVYVEIQESDDDGAGDPWSTIHQDGNVFSGKWYTGQIGLMRYYRMVAFNQAGIALATSASQLWDGSVYT